MRNVVFVFLLCIFSAFSSLAQVERGKYVISNGAGINENWDYRARNSIGQPLIGIIQNQTLVLSSGFWNKADGITSAEELRDITFLEDIIIYPNPTGKYLNVISAFNCTAGIYDIYGRLVVERDVNGNCAFDLSGYTSGMYIIRFRMNNEVQTRKLIKQ